MPQMMPINWIISFIFFIITFLIFNMMNYYILNFNLNNQINFSSSSTQKNYKKSFLIKNLNWKW
uniref:ATP synthase F0 subunit 8 n=1 Tax=Smerkata fusca TaxID=3015559 RepID=UPI0027985828|nr:ATP synthase F0 subunit 8 [Smerkata fusca]WGO62328.1 ATP synthase F0 subunit 8 [Smerkata fusca]